MQEHTNEASIDDAWRNVERLEKVCREFKRLVQYSHFSKNKFRVVFGTGALWRDEFAKECCHFYECDYHYANLRHLTVAPLIRDEQTKSDIFAKVRAMVLKCHLLTCLTVDLVCVHENIAS